MTGAASISPNVGRAVLPNSGGNRENLSQSPVLRLRLSFLRLSFFACERDLPYDLDVLR